MVKRIQKVRSVVENSEFIVVKEAKLMHTIQLIYLSKQDSKWQSSNAHPYLIDQNESMNAKYLYYKCLYKLHLSFLSISFDVSKDHL